MKKRILILLLVILFVAGGIYLWFVNATTPVNTASTESKVFVVHRGDSIREIASNLKKEGLIRDSLAFFILVKKNNFEKIIQAGNFRLSAAMDTATIVQELQHGTLDIWVTIPEGWRIEEIAVKLNEDLAIPEKAFLDNAEEGFMFPDTYLLPKDATPSGIASIMRENFNKKVQNNFQDVLKKNKRSLKEIITLASLVEREAKLPEDRPKVASVLVNRLNLGMKLDIDATVQYALGYQPNEKTWWKQQLTNDDLAIVSPYNTYINSGLPPGPIANPGLASIQAVLEPRDTDYLYYLTDHSGVTHYAATWEEHQLNVNKYLK